MKIGILGLGSIGSRHFQNFKNLGCEVVGHDPEITSYKSYDEVMSCDGIVIASPSKMHYTHILECHGLKKPMLVEKPLVMTHEDNERVPLTYIRMVGYNLRFRSCVKKAKAWMGDGKIGKPHWARFTCAQFNNRPNYRRDGVILNWSHEVDLAFHLLGEGNVMTAYHNKDETIADLIVAHVNNRCITTIHLDYVTVPEQRDFIIVGENGSISGDTFANTVYLLDQSGKLVDGSRDLPSYDQDYIDEAKTFMRLISGHSPDEYCTGQQGQHVVEACLDARFYGESGGR